MYCVASFVVLIAKYIYLQGCVNVASPSSHLLETNTKTRLSDRDKQASSG